MKNDMNSVKGLKVLVTAGASGIGRTIAETFENAGANIHVCDISHEAIETCKSAHPNWGITKCDVSKPVSYTHLRAHET